MMNATNILGKTKNRVKVISFRVLREFTQPLLATSRATLLRSQASLPAPKRGTTPTRKHAPQSLLSSPIKRGGGKRLDIDF
jgi:hypothetical protein